MKIEFYPEFNGNLDKPEKERVSVEISPMTVSENEAMKGRIVYTKVKGFRDKIKDNSAEVLDSIFKERTGAFRNLVDPMTKKPVKTAEEYLKSFCSPDLKIEIIDHIQDISTLNDDQLKNFEPQ